MTDLNLDGLPALFELQRSLSERGNMQLQHELRQLVERERLEEGSHNCDECYGNGLEDGRERLPAWAKPVMRAVKRWDDTNGSWNGMWEIMIEHRKLTEAQLKEIGDG